jgi:hypothetical protein
LGAQNQIEGPLPGVVSGGGEHVSCTADLPWIEERHMASVASWTRACGVN